MSRKHRTVAQRPDTTRKPDGDLTVALRALYDAIDALVEPRIEWADDRIVSGPSPYRQLQSVIAGMQGTGNGHASRSMPPIWVDAIDILNGIDRDAWQAGLPELPQPQPEYTPGAPHRIRELAKRAWRPQDTKRIENLTKALTGWAHKIDVKLNPPRRLHIAAACPACGATTAKHVDSAGEEVNGPALTVIAEHGCTCLECGSFWDPYHYQWLAKVLACPLPAGVLE